MFCLKAEADEVARLKSQVEAKRFYLFSSQIYNLRDLLKCSICLELYNYPVELSGCKHLFCKDCIQSYLEYSDNKDISCPVCQKLIGNGGSEHHEFFDKITSFVKLALEDVNKILGSDLNKLPPFLKVIELWEQNKDTSKIFETVKSTTVLPHVLPDYSEILKAKKVVVKANAKYVCAKTETDDAFDALANLPTQNPYFKKKTTRPCNKTYADKKRESANCYAEKLQKFENDANKKDILNWLEDNRNKFNEIPLTQQQMKEEVPEFDLPSVSQSCVSRRNSRNPQKNKSNITSRTKNNDLVRNRTKRTETKRARSLECYVKLGTPKTTFKRHSLATSTVEEQIIVEEFSGEEDAIASTSLKKVAIVNLLEDKCLDELDKEMLKENKEVSNNTPPSSNKSLRNNRHNNTMDTSRGWNRMKEIKKTIKKTEKKSRKLNVISYNSLSNTVTEDSRNHNTNNRKVKKKKDLPSKILESAEDCDDKNLGLNEAQFSLCNNLSKRSKVILKNSFVNNEEKNTCSALVEKDQTARSHESVKENGMNVEELVESSNSVSCNKDPLSLKINEHAVEEDINQQKPALTPMKGKEGNEVLELREVYTNMLTINGMNNFNDQSQTWKIKETMKPQDLKSNDVFDDDIIFAMPTQEIMKPDSNVFNKFIQEESNNFTKKLQLFQNILNEEKDPEKAFNKLKYAFQDEADEKSGKNILKPVGVQTEELKEPSVVFSDVSTQTGLSHKNIGIQTDSYENSAGFRISSTDMFDIQPVTNSSVQTDCFSCPSCKFIISKIDRNPSQEISPSFDNLNFETQAVIKGQEIYLKDPICKTSIDTNIEPHDVTLIDDKTSQGISETPKSFRGFKRIRTASDADMDLENDHSSQKTKKNRYANDISICFLTESDNNDHHVLQTQGPRPECLTSDDLADVLNNIMDRIDENKLAGGVCKGLLDEKIRIEPIPKRLKTQDIIRECEQIIKEACSTAIRIEHTQCAPESVKSQTILEEFNQNFNTQGLNLAAHNNDIHENKSTKKCSEPLFVSADNLNSSETLKNNNISKENVDDFINQFKEIDDSFEEAYNAEIESITGSMIQDDEEIKKIRIGKDGVDTNTNGNRSTEMFDSDQEVIETTPQKNRPSGTDIISLLSQATHNSRAKMKLSLEDEVKDALSDPLSCFNKTFTPPPEFQDFVDNIDPGTDKNDKEEKENMSSLSLLTTDLLECERSRHHRQHFITSTPFQSSSQVLTSRTLNLSPIHPSNRQMNPILAVQNAGKLPLTITRSKTPPRQRTAPLSSNTPKQQKSILSYVKPGDNLNVSLDKTSLSQISKVLLTPSAQKKPNVACTLMNKAQLSSIIALANKKIITYTSSFSSSVTHMIVAVDKRNLLMDQTMKYVSAVAAGIWVINTMWIEECLKQNKVVPEEQYEALDVSGVDGPRRSRLNRSRNPLLNNYVIYAAPPFRSTTQKEVENLIVLLGGEIVQRPDHFIHHDKGKICLIITENTGSQGSDIYETWLETLKVVTVDMEWLSRSVGKFEIQSLRPFVLCCEESISDLAYPSALLEDVSYSFSHSTLT